MSTAVDRVLAERKARIPLAKRRGVVVVSFVLHASLTALLVLWPTFFKEPPKKFEFVAVTVVPPRALGETTPATRTPPAPKPPPKPPEEKPAAPAPPKEEPAPAPPAPEPKKEAKPLAPDPKSVKPPEKASPPPAPAKEEPKKPATPPAAAAAAVPPPDSLPAAIPKRQGSPFGNPLGASTQQATLGVEDPNFTYGYYLDRIVGVISANWTRPSVGPEIKQSLLYFRIQRDGTIVELRLVESSGSEIFDEAAMRAVQASSPLPPLPKSYAKDILGIHLVVK